MTTLTSMSDGPLLPLLAAVESGSGLLPNDSNSSRLELFAHRFGLTHDSSYLCTACRDSCRSRNPKRGTVSDGTYFRARRRRALQQEPHEIVTGDAEKLRSELSRLVRTLLAAFSGMWRRCGDGR